ncbi:kynureninase [Frigoribacterium sp. CFBP 8751]|uniref:kynureninase n=1 Tax=Frigoribacterium sp. CFBP 8751 TaxID=2775277 RepID=UPI00177E0DEE|nr:aminotransferase class V-fold PLP-dependent enzyme [Frigoribacterium sp. CFBP 8751]MBD8538289.1 aminotransferase class V-fold PLP-dependent enzyme [Frigoribacterium sp. CFBP 8751]
MTDPLAYPVDSTDPDEQASAHPAGPLDAADPLASFVDRFVPAVDVVSYLDGNSLGRPVTATLSRLSEFVEGAWGTRLIRSWDERWMALPTELGDRIAAACLGAAPGQTVVADSTTVLLYKAIRAGLRARPDRHEIVIDDDQFPTDRFVVEGIAREHGATIRWISVDKATGVTVSQVRDVVGPDTALLLVNHVSYRSGWLVDLPAITTLVHEAGGLVLADLCHSVGVVPMQLDEWGVDLAVGCTYKYLNGGPGAPAFVYARASLLPELDQPIQGWMGAADVFAMADGYEAAAGIRRFVSGTPPVMGMLAMHDMLDLIDEAGIDAIRSKSLALTDYAFDLVDAWLVPLGVTVATPRAATERGSHVTITHESFRGIVARLWDAGVVPDFRNPDALRIGLSPLSTSFAEVRIGIAAIRAALLAD